MRVLLTAFEAYDDWDENSSWLALMEMLKQRPSSVELVTRRYPVNLSKMQQLLHQDLAANEYAAVLHLGQSPGASRIKMEAIALNVAGCIDEGGRELPALVESAPLAYRSKLPLDQLTDCLTSKGIPAGVSYHAGTFLCNATMYLSHYWFHAREETTPVGFIHLPLASEQVASSGHSLASLPTATLAAALRLILSQLQQSLQQTKHYVA